MNMTEDYLAISNTGKNITITMTPGMKQRVLGDGDRMRVVGTKDFVFFARPVVGGGYKIFRRKSVWNASFRSAKFPCWPRHERIVYPLSALETQPFAAKALLPKPAQDDFDSKTIAEFQRSDFHLGPPPPPIRNDHPAMSKPEPSRDEPVWEHEYINLAGEYFEALIQREDSDRFWKAYVRTLEKTEARHLFIVPDMVVAAITGACGGFIIALLLAAAGVLK